MHRIEKVQLIVGMNPDWLGLSLAWGKAAEPFDEAKMIPPTKF